MKPVTKITMIGLALLYAAISFPPVAFPGGSPEEPSGEPPHGLAVQGDAAGTKLNGAIFIEYHNFRSEGGTVLADARIVLRLRQGDKKGFLDTLYGETVVDTLTTNDAQQAVITEAMAKQILDAFFDGDLSLQITLKDIAEFGTLGPLPATGGSQFFLADVTIAVK